MSLRALWIISVKTDLPIFSRYFPSVEARCKSTLEELYVKIPPEKELVRSLLLEVGLRAGDVFIESRDRCDKQVLFPAFELRTEQGLLWPVVVMECKEFVLCALAYDDENPKILPSICRVSFATVPSVALSVEILNGLAQCILNSRSPLSEGTSAISEITRYVNVSLPFGRSISCDVSVCNQLTTIIKGKAKVPAWNPAPHKGKSQVVFHIREEIRCMQFSNSEMKDVMDVYGTVSSKVDIEGNVPEISLVVTHSTAANGVGLIVNPGVCNVEKIGETSRLRFYPSNCHPLCHYMLPPISDPPIYGGFTMKINDMVATLNLQLQLKNNVKNLFQQLEAHIPFPGLIIQSVRPNYSQGSVKIASKNIVVWTIGSKFPSKTLTVTLNAIVKLNKIPKYINSDLSSIMETTSINFTDNISDVTNSAHALLLFKIADYTYSGTKIDPQSILVSTVAKVRCSVSSEVVSKVYKLWNSEGQMTIPASIYAEELKILMTKS